MRSQCIVMSRKIFPEFLEFMEIDKPLVLCPHQVQFFQYFISKYHEHFKKAEFQEANHCAVAVVLELEKLLEFYETGRS